ncbi:MAG: ABC transporter permease, partial [Chloroflexi bacterium]|nr:ABC transporter permease [Chloroflexota bacterium]
MGRNAVVGQAQRVAPRRASFHAAEARLGWALVAPAILVVVGMVAYP